MTFASLHALRDIICDAIDDIERVYARNSCKSEASATSPSIDFPGLDVPGDRDSESERLTSHPEVLEAISRIISAAGHMTAVVRAPFLTLNDTSLGVRHILQRRQNYPTESIFY